MIVLRREVRYAARADALQYSVSTESSNLSDTRPVLETIPIAPAIGGMSVSITTKVFEISVADFRRNQSPRTFKSQRRVGFQTVSTIA